MGVHDDDDDGDNILLCRSLDRASRIEAMGVETESEGGRNPAGCCGTERPGAPARLPRMPKPSLARGAAALIRLMLIRRYPSAAPLSFVFNGPRTPVSGSSLRYGTLHSGWVGSRWVDKREHSSRGAVVPLARTKRPGGVCAVMFAFTMA